jgi:hypothetical protein
MMFAAMQTGRNECVGVSVVTGVDAPRVFELSEHDLDFVALVVEHGIVRDADFVIGFGGESSFDLSCCQCITEPIGFVAFITEKCFGVCKGVDHQRSTAEIAYLAFRK